MGANLSAPSLLDRSSVPGCGHSPRAEIPSKPTTSASTHSSLALVLSCILLAQGTSEAELLLRDHPLLFAFQVLNFASTVALAVASLTLPRRPDVYIDGKLVDRMYTVSAFTRFTFAWPWNILSLARRRRIWT